ncbi:MAG: site-specific integrase [Sporomusaceae bacterium]|nr:site-specific integrase [Sporomusaceae bacterium]
MSKTVRKMQNKLKVQDLIGEFVNEKRLEGLGKFAIEAIEFTLYKFFQYYKRGFDEGEELGKAVRTFLTDGKGNEYYNKQLSILSRFFKHCIAMELLKENPCQGLKYKKHTRRIVDLDKTVIKELLKLPDQKTFAGFRNWVLMILILDTGIRPYEALQLRISDFRETLIWIRPEISKTRQERFLPLSKGTISAIKKLIAVRHDEWEKNGYIFCGFEGEQLSHKTMQYQFRQYSKRLGTKVTLYDLRHTFALWYIRNNGNAFSLQAILGHTTMEMTRVYVQLVEADISNNHAQASPINTLLSEQHRLNKIKR